MSAEGERAVAQYRLLVGGLNALARHAHPAAAIGESYVLRALALAGWTPRLHSCVVCGRHVAVSPVAGESGDDGGAGEGRMSGPMFFSPSAGGLMCSTDRTPDAKRIDPDEWCSSRRRSTGIGECLTGLRRMRGCCDLLKTGASIIWNAPFVPCAC